MYTVLLSGDSRYPIDRARLRRVVKRSLKEFGAKGEVSVSVKIGGDRMMRQLNNQYRKLDKSCNVLSFPTENLSGEGEEFKYPKKEAFPLGDVVISYPKAREQAVLENVFVDDVIEKLLIHGVKSLLGQHDD